MFNLRCYQQRITQWPDRTTEEQAKKTDTKRAKSWGGKVDGSEKPEQIRETEDALTVSVENLKAKCKGG